LHLIFDGSPNSNYYCNRLSELDKKEKGQALKACETSNSNKGRINMKKYRHLTFEDRVYIEVWRFERRSLKYMAFRLGVAPSTISRELKRGKTGWLAIGYRADLGEKRRQEFGAKKGAKPKIVGKIRELIIKLIQRDWSPEQISGRLKLENKVMISHETIYTFIKTDKMSGGRLYLHLRHGKRRRKKRFSIPRVRADILNRKHIQTRPAVINQRKRIGDWERDLMFGDSRSAALLTIVERKTLLTIIKVVKSKSPKEIAAKTIEAFSRSKVKCHSITNDNGFEFRDHQRESKILGVPIYFTNPYSSWEKGTNENTNGLIRQYFFRNSSMKEFTNEDAYKIQRRLNTRPRKKLGFQTPLEASTKKTIRTLC
jgi:IS30 family transposase